MGHPHPELGCDTMGGMEHIANLKLHVISGEFAGKWIRVPRLANKNGTSYRAALPWEDAERHPENFIICPTFTDDEGSAWKSVTLESALQQKHILRYAGIETELL